MRTSIVKRTLTGPRATLPLVASLLLAASPAAQPRPQSAATPPDVPAFLARLDSLREASGIPGLSVAVVKDREVIVAAGLGYADPEQRLAATAETPYNIASVTKPIAAVVALQLSERGALDLDRPMVEYSDWRDFCIGFSGQPSIFAKGLQCEPLTHTLRHLLSHTAIGQAGTSFSYNPVLYSWASRPMMAVSDTSFSELVRVNVLEPAGMTRSARINRDLPLRSDLATRLAPPHRVDSTGAIVRAPAPPAQGDGAAGGVISTVLDLAKFDVALDTGALISAESRRAMMTPTRSEGGVPVPYGIGWFVQEHLGHTMVWHSGWWEDTYSALYLKIPDLRLTFIVLANSEGIWWDNPLDDAAVQRSEFAQAFFEAFVEN